MKDCKIYKILTICNLFCPFAINRIYLGNASLGRILTLDYMLLGALADLFYMDKTFDEAMAKRGDVNTKIRNKED